MEEDAISGFLSFDDFRGESVFAENSDFITTMSESKVVDVEDE